MGKHKRYKLIVIAGPTACGKTGFAVRLARKLDTEIISADSMQVYKWLEFVTFAPVDPEEKRIHHLVSFLDPGEEYDAARFVSGATDIIQHLWGKNLPAIVCGGTGMYIKALLEGLFPIGSDVRIKNSLLEQAAAEGLDFLYRKLMQIDPLACEKIHKNDKRRIVRALEVFYMTGRPISQWQAETKGLADIAEVDFVGLIPSNRGWLRERIARRIDENITEASLDKLSDILPKLGKTSSKAIGVKELSLVLRGELNLDAAKEMMKASTYQYARRQMIWFRAQKQMKAVDPVKLRDLEFRI